MKNQITKKCLYLLLALLFAPLLLMAQERKVSLELNGAPLAKVLDEIGRKTSLSVVYNV